MGNFKLTLRGSDVTPAMGIYLLHICWLACVYTAVSLFFLHVQVVCTASNLLRV